MRWPLAAVALVLGGAVACENAKEPPVSPPNPLADSADQVMFGISTVITEKGLLRAQLQADTAYFFEGNTRIEVRNEKTTFFTNTGEQNAVLTSKEGTYNTGRNTMEARKSVLVVSVDGRRLVTQQLRYNQSVNQISSDSAFVLTEPGREVHGIGFTSDPNLTNIVVKRVDSARGPLNLPGETAPGAGTSGFSPGRGRAPSSGQIVPTPPVLPAGARALPAAPESARATAQPRPVTPQAAPATPQAAPATPPAAPATPVTTPAQPPAAPPPPPPSPPASSTPPERP